ncbi:SHOCT domain-containing protein [Pseudomaricurvus alcaniphilus]|uniref:SHOCT domain-containing protein n=1 Tax=Pseudomaricurvus alcaniphilus TaxID=1166482 RepID=UPI001A9F4607
MKILGFLAILMLFGCASVTEQVPDEQVLLISGNVYEILDVDRRGIFGGEASLQKSVLRQADKFASEKGKVASPLAARIHRVGILGDWAWFWYKFELVDQGAPESYRNMTDIDIVRDARLSTEFFMERHNEVQKMDVSGEIRSLDKLRQDGLITDSEFEEQKRKILDRSP